MNKWLVAGGVLVIALLVLIYLQLHAPEAIAQPTAKPAAAEQVAAAEAKADSSFKKAAEKLEAAAAATAQPGKIDLGTDAFYYHYDEVVVPKLTMAVIQNCYETGGLDRVGRDDKAVFKYRYQVKDGVFSFTNIRVIPDKTTITNQHLLSCMAAEIAKVHWTDGQMPDTGDDDEILFRPERNKQKYGKDAMAYEGDGPTEYLKTMPPAAKGSREQPEDHR